METTRSNGKFVLLFLLIIISATAFFLIPGLNSVVDGVKNADIYYKEAGYKDIGEINLETLDFSSLNIYYGEGEIIDENLLKGEIYFIDTKALQANGHSQYKHGKKALTVISCIDSSKGLIQIINPKTKRIAIVCTIQTDDPDVKKYNGRWGIGIFEENSANVTAFIKEKLSTINELFKYLYDQGYTTNNPFIPPEI